MDTVNFKDGWSSIGMDNQGRLIIANGDVSNPHTKQVYVNLKTGVGQEYQGGQLVGEVRVTGLSSGSGGSSSPPPAPVPADDPREEKGLLARKSGAAADATKTHDHTHTTGPSTSQDVSYHVPSGPATPTAPSHDHVTPAQPAAPSSPDPVNVPDWAKGLPGWKPGDKKVIIGEQGPTQSTIRYGYQDSKGDVIYQAANGNILEDPAGSAGPYVVKKAEHTTPTDSVTNFVSENGAAAQPHAAATPLVSEHGQGGGFISDNSPAAQPRAPHDLPLGSPSYGGFPGGQTPPWQEAHLDVLPEDKVGDKLEPHGMGIAMRDSKDGSKEIVQMTDGTYQSVDKTTGDVTSAGTWGDGHGGGTAVNGYSNPILETKPTTPAWTQDVNRGTSISDHGSTLASRDSKDGTKTIFQMSDGTYQTVDKATGNYVGGAGTWGDGHGGGTGVNGIGNPVLQTTSAPQPDASTSDPMSVVSGVYTPPQPSQPSVSVVTSNAPTLPPTDTTTSPPAGVTAFDPSASATNVHRFGRTME